VASEIDTNVQSIYSVTAHGIDRGPLTKSIQESDDGCRCRARERVCNVEHGTSTKWGEMS
jgi:hypothetical protein